MTYVSFPGFGIEPFHMDRIAFSLFGVNVNWYGLIITCGMILAVLYALWHAKFERVKTDDIIDLELFLIVAGVIGARLYYVIMEFDQYLVTNGTFWKNLTGTLYNIIAVWNGGLAIYGGIIAGVITIVCVCRYKKIPMGAMLDCATYGLLIGQIIGRWGNFMNREAFGAQTEIFCRMGLTAPDGSTIYVHPTFLYESLWNLALLIALIIFERRGKRRYDGQCTLLYFFFYGLGRLWIEGLRTDSLYIGQSGIRVSQLLSLALILAAGTAMFMIWKRGPEPEKLFVNQVRLRKAGEDTGDEQVYAVSDEETR